VGKAVCAGGLQTKNGWHSASPHLASNAGARSVSQPPKPYALFGGGCILRLFCREGDRFILADERNLLLWTGWPSGLRVGLGRLNIILPRKLIFSMDTRFMHFIGYISGG
jgi:hypothetical protein